MKQSYKALLISALFFPIVSSAASFDCNKRGSTLEAFICVDDEVSAMDSEVASQYLKLKKIHASDEFKSANDLAAQRDFLRQRNSACPIPASGYHEAGPIADGIWTCLKSQYRVRLQNLDKQLRDDDNLTPSADASTTEKKKPKAKDIQQSSGKSIQPQEMSADEIMEKADNSKLQKILFNRGMANYYLFGIFIALAGLTFLLIMPKIRKFRSYLSQVTKQLKEKPLPKISLLQALERNPRISIVLCLIFVGLTMSFIDNRNAAEQKSKDIEARNMLMIRETSGEAYRKVIAENTPTTPEREYEAILTCEMNEWHQNLIGCFVNRNLETEIELTNGKSYGLYKGWEFHKIGKENGDGFHIKLKNHFDIKIQNADSTSILGLKVIDSTTGEIVFRKKVSQYGVIQLTN